MYFSIGTMTTIAYGDIVPLNPLSTLYITIALVAYTISFAYILSEILRILMEAQASKLEHSNNLLIVSNMMKNNKIN
jgi:voltage-gated potassium channel Kch